MQGCDGVRVSRYELSRQKKSRAGALSVLRRGGSAEAAPVTHARLRSGARPIRLYTSGSGWLPAVRHNTACAWQARKPRSRRHPPPLLVSRQPSPTFACSTPELEISRLPWCATSPDTPSKVEGLTTSLVRARTDKVRPCSFAPVFLWRGAAGRLLLPRSCGRAGVCGG